MASACQAKSENCLRWALARNSQTHSNRNGTRIRRVIDQPDHWQSERPPYNSCPVVAPALRMATRRQRLTLLELLDGRFDRRGEINSGHGEGIPDPNMIVENDASPPGGKIDLILGEVDARVVRLQDRAP